MRKYVCRAHFSLRLRHTELAPSFMKQNKERQRVKQQQQQHMMRKEWILKKKKTHNKNCVSHMSSILIAKYPEWSFPLVVGAFTELCLCMRFVFFLLSFRFCFFFGLWFNILPIFVIVIIYMHAWVCAFCLLCERNYYIFPKILHSIEMKTVKKITHARTHTHT